MPWLPVAFSAPILWAVSTHIDKYLVDRYFHSRDVGPLLVFTAVIDLPFIAGIALFDHRVFALPASAIALVTFTGILYMAAMYLYLQALQQEEATVVAPFFQLGPVFAFALAYAILHELPTPRQTVGGALILIASALISIDLSHRRSFRLRVIALMVACALALAVSSVIFKVFSLRDEFWSTTFWTYSGEVVFGVGVLAVPALREAFAGLLRVNRNAIIGVNGANELINLAGSVIGRYALLLAPVAIVQAISGTTTLFVFFIGLGLSMLFPRIGSGRANARDLLQKGAAAALVGIGVALLSA
jgi:uncharacterized membrane protein